MKQYIWTKIKNKTRKNEKTKQNNNKQQTKYFNNRTKKQQQKAPINPFRSFFFRLHWKEKFIQVENIDSDRTRYQPSLIWVQNGYAE